MSGGGLVAEREDPLVSAARAADWQQVVLNGGPPCFCLEDDGSFCLRAERWTGHGAVHDFVPLDLLLAEVLSPNDPDARLAVISKIFEVAPTYMEMEDAVRALDEVFKRGQIGAAETRIFNRMRQALIALAEIAKELP